MYGISPRSALIKRDGNYLDADIDNRKDTQTCETLNNIDETSKQGIKVKAYFEPGRATDKSKDELYKSEGNCDDCLTCGDDCKCNNHQQWTLNLGDAFDPDRLDIYFNNVI